MVHVYIISCSLLRSWTFNINLAYSYFGHLEIHCGQVNNFFLLIRVKKFYNYNYQLTVKKKWPFNFAFRFPTQSRNWCTLNTARLLIIAIYICVPIIYLPVYFSFTIKLINDDEHFVYYQVNWMINCSIFQTFYCARVILDRLEWLCVT